MNVKRYNLVPRMRGMWLWYAMQEEPEIGDWVRYDDVKNLLQDPVSVGIDWICGCGHATKAEHEAAELSNA